MPAISRVSVADALSADADVPNGVEQPPLISGDILAEPLGQRLDGTSEALKTQPHVPRLRELHQFGVRLVRSRPTVDQGHMYLEELKLVEV